MYLDELGREVPCPDNQAGLYIMPRRQQQQHTTGSSSCSSLGPVRVQVPTSVAGTSYALYQIGETSQIQSGGLLQATPHAVMMSSSSSGITRESFAVFMEPEFDTELHIPAGKTLDDCIGSSLDDDDDNHNSSSSCTCAGITSIQVPSLKGRYKPGQTFGEFHLATVSAFTTTTQQ